VHDCLVEGLFLPQQSFWGSNKIVLIRREILPIIVANAEIRSTFRLSHLLQEDIMSVDLVLGGITAIGLGLYLVYALIHPEKF